MKTQYVLVATSVNSIPSEFIAEVEKKLVSSSFLKNSSRYFQMSFESESQNLKTLDSEFRDLSVIYQVDVAIIPKEVFDTPKKLVVFDMDSTLITSEVIVEMALCHGVGEEVKEITKRAMNGELDFNQSLSQRVSLLKGFHRSHMEGILKRLKFTPGVEKFIKTLRKNGIKTAIASGGFQYFANDIQSQLMMDYVFANELEFQNDELTGKISGHIVNAEAKEEIIEVLAQNHGFSLNEIVAIGDGANDIPMLLKSGLGIAIHAKEKVQREANYRLNFGPMDHALYFMNMDGEV